MFLPHMSGTGCPVVDEHGRGALVGLRGLANAGDIWRAVIEGLNYQFLDIVAAMESCLGGTAGQSAGKFIAVGGATRNEFWLQNKADVVGRPIEVPAIEEATPLGAAILAGIGVGLYRDEEDGFAHVGRPGKTYVPDAQLSARYAEWFAVYRQLHPALRPVHRQL
jgi:xylulokinase